MCPPRLPLRDFLSAAAGQDRGKGRAQPLTPQRRSRSSTSTNTATWAASMQKASKRPPPAIACATGGSTGGPPCVRWSLLPRPLRHLGGIPHGLGPRQGPGSAAMRLCSTRRIAIAASRARLRAARATRLSPAGHGRRQDVLQAAQVCAASGASRSPRASTSPRRSRAVTLPRRPRPAAGCALGGTSVC